MSTITARDGTEIYYKDWGAGRPVVFSHAWPLSADAWDDEMVYFATRGYRVIAHDRRGHGRSDQSWIGHDLDTYADDLADLIAALGLRGVILVGHSTGSGEVARYVGRYGTTRVSKVVLVSMISPRLLKTAANLGGVVEKAFDELREGVLCDRAECYRHLSERFFGASVSPGLREFFWLQAMRGSLQAELECIKLFCETDLMEDLRRLDVPTLIVHGDDDRLVPIGASLHAARKLVRRATFEIYKGAPHGLPSTHRERLCADILSHIEVAPEVHVWRPLRPNWQEGIA